tara:strand:- start:134 stop:703 length:570 start_codon:yes stop_codon:yes gene_type:complete
MPKPSKFVDRKVMAEMAGISLRSLLNYKTDGTVTAWKIEDANRVRYDWRKVLKQLEKAGKATGTTSKASTAKQAPVELVEPVEAVAKAETTPTIQEVQSKVAEVKQTLQAYVEAPAAKAVQVAGAEAVEQTTVESWVENAAIRRDESTKRLHEIFAEQRANFLKTPKELERDALAAKSGSLPQWQDPFG